LRAFRAFAASRPVQLIHRPASVTCETVEAFIHEVNRDGASWSWVASNIAVLRGVFDKLAGLRLTIRLCTPKRPWRLPDILAPGEIARLIQAANTVRDRLIVGLLYGCGIKVGELCALRWQDINTGRRLLTVRFARATRTREVPIPDALQVILEAGVRQCPAGDHVFPGALAGKPITARLIERVVRGLADAAGIGKKVTCMTLRHSYAVDCLRGDMSVRQLQQLLGHRSLFTTMGYCRYILPAGVVSPADRFFSDSAAPCSAGTLLPGHPPASRNGECDGMDIRSMALALLPSAFCVLPRSSFPFPALEPKRSVFFVMIRTCLRDRFLALRRAVLNTS